VINKLEMLGYISAEETLYTNEEEEEIKKRLTGWGYL
jgi:hypothetical protein